MKEYTSLADIKSGYFITQRGQTRIFNVFKTFEEYLNYKKNTSQPDFNELIKYSAPRKFFLDIDLEKDEPSDQCLDTFNKYIQCIKLTIVEVFNKKFHPKCIDKNDIAEVYSHGHSKGKYKYSANLILMHFAMPNHETFREFGLEVRKLFLNRFPNTPSTFIDIHPFNSSQFFNRLPGCTKFNGMRSEERYKTWKSNHDELDLILTNVEKMRFVESVLFVEKEFEFEQSTEYPEELDEIKDVWSKSFCFRNMVNNIAVFDRQAPSMCDICNRIHETENSLYIIIYEDMFVIRCRRSDEEERESIFIPRDSEIAEFNAEIEEFATTKKGFKTKKKEYDSEKPFRSKRKSFESNKLTPIKNTTKCDDPEINTDLAFTDKPINCVKAYKKMGKTKCCLQYIENNEFESIIIGSFRKTFTTEMLSKFPDFESYLDIQGPITSEHSKIVIQMESLNRLDISTHDCDLLILDEIESIISQFGSGNFRDLSGCVAVFQSLIKRAKRIVIMDADLSDRTIFLMRKIRDYFDEEANLYINTYNPSKDIQFNFVGDSEWLYFLDQKLSKNKNVAIFTNSLKQGKKIEQFVLKRKLLLPNQVITYSSETLESIKTKHFSDVNKYWSKYRLIICTPTISAGVSFEVPHFNVVMGYFTNMSCNAQTCHQMIARVRNVMDKEIYVHISENKEKKYHTDKDRIEYFLAEKRIELLSEIGDKYGLGNLQHEFCGDEITYHKSFYYWVVVCNISYDNDSRNNFKGLFRSMISDHVMKFNIEVDKKELNDVIRDAMQSQHEINEGEKKMYLEAPIITDEKKEEIMLKRRNREDVPIHEIYESKKYDIIKAADIVPENFDKHTLVLKQKEDRKRIHRSRLINDLIIRKGSWEKAIEQIKIDELQIYNKMNSLEMVRGFTMKSDYAIHKNIMLLLRQFRGFDRNYFDSTKDDIRKLHYVKPPKYQSNDGGDELRKLIYKTYGMINGKCGMMKKDETNLQLLTRVISEFYYIRYTKDGPNPEPNLIVRNQDDLYRGGKKISAKKLLDKYSGMPIIDVSDDVEF